VVTLIIPVVTLVIPVVTPARINPHAPRSDIDIQCGGVAHRTKQRRNYGCGEDEFVHALLLRSFKPA
jgi:hypothetical protein